MSVYVHQPSVIIMVAATVFACVFSPSSQARIDIWLGWLGVCVYVWRWQRWVNGKPHIAQKPDKGEGDATTKKLCNIIISNAQVKWQRTEYKNWQYCCRHEGLCWASKMNVNVSLYSTALDIVCMWIWVRIAYLPLKWDVRGERAKKWQRQQHDQHNEHQTHMNGSSNRKPNDAYHINIYANHKYYTTLGKFEEILIGIPKRKCLLLLYGAVRCLVNSSRKRDGNGEVGQSRSNSVYYWPNFVSVLETFSMFVRQK